MSRFPPGSLSEYLDIVDRFEREDGFGKTFLTTSPSVAPSGSVSRCYRCNEAGHIATYCPRRVRGMNQFDGSREAFDMLRGGPGPRNAPIPWNSGSTSFPTSFGPRNIRREIPMSGWNADSFGSRSGNAVAPDPRRSSFGQTRTTAAAGVSADTGVPSVSGPQRTPATSGSLLDVVCFRCGVKGHIARNCNTGNVQRR